MNGASYLHVAAQDHGRGRHGEVDALDLADPWSVIGLNCHWSHRAELKSRKRSVYVIVLHYVTHMRCFLTVYEPMALIWVTMAELTSVQGTPINLEPKHIMKWLSVRPRNVRVPPDDLAESAGGGGGGCCIFAAREDPHPHEDGTGHAQSPETHPGTSVLELQMQKWVGVSLRAFIVRWSSRRHAESCGAVKTGFTRHICLLNIRNCKYLNLYCVFYRQNTNIVRI